MIGASWQECPVGSVISISVDEHADMWVTYTDAFGPSETGHQSGTVASFLISGFGTWILTDVVLHAEDDAGNEVMLSPMLAPCLEIGL